VKSGGDALCHHRHYRHAEVFFLLCEISSGGGRHGWPESGGDQAGAFTLGQAASRRWQGRARLIWAALVGQFGGWRIRPFRGGIFSIAAMTRRAALFIVGTMGTRELYSTTPQKASAFALWWLFPWLRCGLGSLGTQKARRGVEFLRACGSPACPPAQGAGL